MMLKALSILCLLALCYSYPSPSDTDSKDLDKLIDDIFGPQTPKDSTPSRTEDTTTPNKIKDTNKLLDDIFGPQTPKDSTPSRTEDTTTPNKIKGDEKCTLTNGKEGLCVPYYLCDIMKMDEDGVIDSHVPECVSYIDMCCDVRHVTTSPPELAKKPEA